MEGFLSAKDVIGKYIEGCQTKVQMSFMTLMGKSIFAGMMIALGACGSNVAAHTISDVGLARFVAGLVFPVGLMMVILLGAELFTGDCLMAIGVADRKQKVKDLIRVLIIVFIGNFIGASFLALFASMSGQFSYSAGLLGAYTIKVAAAKANISFVQAVVSGILCNILVCAAVLMAMCAKDITGKLFSAFFVIMLFVTCGFEHCVANMYYITAGLIAKYNPEYSNLAIEYYNCTAEQIANLDWYHFLVTNLVPVTIGNILGGMLFLGVPLYLLNYKKKTK